MSQTLIAQALLAGGVIAATVVLHAAFIVAIRPLLGRGVASPGIADEVGGLVRLTFVGLWLITAHVGAAAIWALAYLRVGVSATFEDALYFALSTYTTLGFGDVLAPKEWQLLTGFASLNGLMLFGLTAAVLVDAASHLRRHHGS